MMVCLGVPPSRTVSGSHCSSSKWVIALVAVLIVASDRSRCFSCCCYAYDIFLQGCITSKADGRGLTRRTWSSSRGPGRSCRPKRGQGWSLSEGALGPSPPRRRERKRPCVVSSDTLMLPLDGCGKHQSHGLAGDVEVSHFLFPWLYILVASGVRY